MPLYCPLKNVHEGFTSQLLFKDLAVSKSSGSHTLNLLRIRLIHGYRTELLDRIFDGFCHMPGMSVEQVGEEMIVIAKQVQNALAESKKIQHSPRGVFVLPLQQVVDSWCWPDY